MGWPARDERAKRTGPGGPEHGAPGPAAPAHANSGGGRARGTPQLTDGQRHITLLYCRPRGVVHVALKFKALLPVGMAQPRPPIPRGPAPQPPRLCTTHPACGTGGCAPSTMPGRPTDTPASPIASSSPPPGHLRMHSHALPNAAQTKNRNHPHRCHLRMP